MYSNSSALVKQFIMPELAFMKMLVLSKMTPWAHAYLDNIIYNDDMQDYLFAPELEPHDVDDIYMKFMNHALIRCILYALGSSLLVFPLT